MKDNLVKKVDAMAASVQNTSQNVNSSELPQKQYDPTAHLVKREKDAAQKLKPVREIKVKVTTALREDREKEREYMWEYVTGVFENRFAIGEALTVWNNPFPGDPCSEWIVPANRPVQIPRWLARFLNTRSYVQFKFRERPIEKGMENQFMETFEADTVHQRATFMNIEMY